MPNQLKTKTMKKERSFQKICKWSNMFPEYLPKNKFPEGLLGKFSNELPKECAKICYLPEDILQDFSYNCCNMLTYSLEFDFGISLLIICGELLYFYF